MTGEVVKIMILRRVEIPILRLAENTPGSLSAAESEDSEGKRAKTTYLGHFDEQKQQVTNGDPKREPFK